MSKTMGVSAPPGERAKLISWKEIAAFLGKDVRTARRWEAARGMPVHRVPGGKGGSVFAYPDELEVWMNNSRPNGLLENGASADSPSQFSPPRGTPVAALPASLARDKAITPRRVALLAVLGLAVLAGAYIRENAPSPPAATPAAQRIMLAVLPFMNLSSDPRQEYFSDGVTEELIAKLGGLSPRRLGVIGRTSVMVYKTAPSSIRKIGKDLGVAYVLEGSVLRQGNRVRVMAQLIRVSDQTHVWAGSYDRTTGDIYSLEDQVSREIASEIRIEFSTGQQKPLVVAPTLNAAAHENYLEGRYYWNQRSPVGLKRSVAFFERAIALDPGFALAYAGLADTYNVMSGYGVMPPSESYSKARAMALRALELDDTLAEAHTTLASIMCDHDHDWTGAEREFHRALELDPGYATAHEWHSENLSWMGHHAEALKEMERARTLDPLSPSINTGLGSALYMARQYDASIQALRRTVELNPDFAYAHSRLGYSYLQKGMLAQGRAEFDAALRLSKGNPNYLAGVGRALALAGKNSEAEKVAEKMAAPSQKGYVSPFAVALVYASAGEKDRAFAFLEKAYREKDDNINAVQVEPSLDGIRGDPRFQTLCGGLTSARPYP